MKIIKFLFLSACFACITGIVSAASMNTNDLNLSASSDAGITSSDDILTLARARFIGDPEEDVFDPQGHGRPAGQGNDLTQNVDPYVCETKYNTKCSDYAPKVGTGASCGGKYIGLGACKCPQKYDKACDGNGQVGFPPPCEGKYTKCTCKPQYVHTESDCNAKGNGMVCNSDKCTATGEEAKCTACQCHPSYNQTCTGDYAGVGLPCGGKYTACKCIAPSENCQYGCTSRNCNGCVPGTCNAPPETCFGSPSRAPNSDCDSCITQSGTTLYNCIERPDPCASCRENPCTGTEEEVSKTPCTSKGVTKTCYQCKNCSGRTTACTSNEKETSRATCGGKTYYSCSPKSAGDICRDAQLACGSAKAQMIMNCSTTDANGYTMSCGLKSSVSGCIANAEIDSITDTSVNATCYAHPSGCTASTYYVDKQAGSTKRSQVVGGVKKCQ